jgi:hypothetical protein
MAEAAKAARVCAGCLPDPIGTITAGKPGLNALWPLGQLPVWDSLARMTIVFELESKTGRQLCTENCGDQLRA